jgi:hypothetical protein
LAVDKAGNKGTSAFQLWVVDTTAPTITVRASLGEDSDEDKDLGKGNNKAVDILVYSSSSTNVKWNKNKCTAVDAVNLSPTITYSPASNSKFELGKSTTVSVHVHQVEDRCGIALVSC